ncbi:DUF6445 family protein [Roseateles chitosanitabidus]|uniref:DUF6445 family protein n=1 Tax=Roseateles chitosanitabidus TaxID=65048 RepID=UPI001B0FDE14|nr:DUF6445 family protein [Roseateles chitosanitabidus]MBO9687772.1 hypothetical protein [Roseateles chitosanitabidus]
MSSPYSVRMPPEVQSVRVGDHSVVFIDDFLEDPLALVEAAAASRFERCAGLAERKGYPGIRAQAPAEYSAQLVELMDPLIKINFGVPEELGARKSPCSFSLTTVPPHELGELQRIPHFDASGPNYMAVLLYLCDGRHGGTGFYRHKATGLQRITRENVDRYQDACYGELDRQPPPPRYFDDSSEHFEFLGMIPAKFNRVVIYPGSLLHTACVNPGLSVSDDPRQGRLTVNTFFDF